ncbi:MAG: Glycine zipper [Chthoniobacter sp.]|jgi:hypothetical protein|nr:Glycine zipper [Chthoniobacter sp.]
MKKTLPLISFGLFVAMIFSGCGSSGDNALAGAAAGAAIGGLLHGRGSDALRGAAIGAGAGYLIGKAINHHRRYDREREYSGRPPYEEEDNLPYARPTNRYGFVTSPYPPHNLIDVRGIPRGAQVEDPSCGQAFINP